MAEFPSVIAEAAAQLARQTKEAEAAHPLPDGWRWDRQFEVEEAGTGYVYRVVSRPVRDPRYG